MRGQLAQQCPSLVSIQESDSTRGLFEEPYRWCTIEPFPVADTLAQDRPNEREGPVYSCTAASVRSLRFGDRIDQTPIDILKFPIDQITLEPTQLVFVVLDTGLVGLFTKPTDPRLLPDAPWPIPKLVESPDFALQLVVQLLRLDLVAGLSRSSYSLATWRGEVDPPDRPALSK